MPALAAAVTPSNWPLLLFSMFSAALLQQTGEASCTVNYYCGVLIDVVLLICSTVRYFLCH